jgi:type I restriction enzyme S subunit
VKEPEETVQGALPSGWAWATVDEITIPHPPKLKPEPKSDLLFLGMDGIAPGRMQPHGFGRFSQMKSSASYFKPGDVLYGRLRPYLNKVWCADREGAASAEFINFRVKEGIEPKFLAYLLHSAQFVQFASTQVNGDRPRIDPEQVRAFPFKLPPSREQSRIVARIEELFGEIEAGEQELVRAREGLEAYRRSVLKAAVTGELTRGWRELNKPNAMGEGLRAGILAERRAAWERAEVARREALGMPMAGNAWKRSYPEAVTADLTEPVECPSEWAICSVDEAGFVLLGRQRAPQHHAGEHMRPYLRVANVLEDHLDLSDVKAMNFTPEEYLTFSLLYGDILLNEGQAPHLIGRPAIYRGEIDGCCFQKTLLRFRAVPGVLPEYAQLVFRYYMHAGRFKRASRITTNIGHLTQVRFLPMPFPVPSLEEQTEIVGRAEALLGIMDSQELDELEHQSAAARKSILSMAFAGKLVQQYAEEEPADVLLKNVQSAESATGASRTKTSRRRAKEINS